MTGALDPARVDVLNAKVRAALRAADTRAGEARREKVSWLTPDHDLNPMVRGGRRLWHTVIMLLRGADRPLDANLRQEVGPALTAAGTALALAARALATGMRANTDDHLHAALEGASTAVAVLETRMDHLTHSGALGGEGASLMQLAAAVAACAHLQDNLTELAARLMELRAPSSD